MFGRSGRLTRRESHARGRAPARYTAWRRRTRRAVAFRRVGPRCRPRRQRRTRRNGPHRSAEKTGTGALSDDHTERTRGARELGAGVRRPRLSGHDRGRRRRPVADPDPQTRPHTQRNWISRDPSHRSSGGDDRRPGPGILGATDDAPTARTGLRSGSVRARDGRIYRRAAGDLQRDRWYVAPSQVRAHICTATPTGSSGRPQSRSVRLASAASRSVSPGVPIRSRASPNPPARLRPLP